MSRAEKFISDYTRNCSNELCAVEDRFGKKVISYHEWLTPDQARSAVEIEREEMIDKAIGWLDKNVAKYLVDTSIHGVKVTGIHTSLTEELRKELEQ